MTTQSEDPGIYKVTKQLEKEDKIIKQALKILESRLFTAETFFTDPSLVRNYLTLNLASKEHEVFVGLFLNNANGLIAIDELASGTIDGSSIYPREIVKRALHLNAAAVIFAHNHPSGANSASEPDKNITRKLKETLSLFDIRVLDHFIVCHMEIVSFAEQGLL